MKGLLTIIVLAIIGLAIIGSAPPIAGLLIIGYIGYWVGSRIKATKDHYNDVKHEYKEFRAWKDAKDNRK